MATKPSNTSPDSRLVIAVEDGAGHGHFVIVTPPAFSGSDALKAVALVGFKYEATRSLQAVAKKAKRESKDVGTALSESAATLAETINPDIGNRVDTVGSVREHVAREMMKTRLAAQLAGKPEATVEATISANLPKFLAKRGEEIEAAFVAHLAAGYTPKARGAKTADGTAPAAIEIGDDVL